MRTTIPCLAMLATLGACADGEDKGGPTDETPVVPEDVLRGYAELVYQSYTRAASDAGILQDTIEGFLDDPSDQRLRASREAWLQAREPYGRTEVFRFYGGPIDDETTGPEGRINSWPMDEVYVDYVVEDPEAGLVNDLSVPIDTETLIAKNQPLDVEGGEAAVSTGWHAIEFLLWGQDLRDDGPGDRPATDFQDGGTAANQDRRREYLRVTTALLVADLEGLRDAWAGDAPYRTEFEAGGNDSLLKIVTGMGSLAGSELSGERMQVAMDTQSQEDEHSCFSDNTHRDIVLNAEGIRNAWIGGLGEDGLFPNLRDAVAEEDAELADRVTAALDATATAAEQIRAPFDQEILVTNADGRDRVQTTITALRAESELVVEVATLYGLTLNLE